MKKAKQQAKEFMEGLTNENVNRKIMDLLKEFSDEVTELQKIRHCKNDISFFSIIKDQNDKWNSLISKTNGSIMRDGFLNYWKKQIPELERIRGTI